MFKGRRANEIVFPQEISHRKPWQRTRSSSLRSRQLVACWMARLCYKIDWTIKNVTMYFQCQREWHTPCNAGFSVLHSGSLNLHRNESETLHYRTVRFRTALRIDENGPTKELMWCPCTSDEWDVKRSGSDLYRDRHDTCAFSTPTGTHIVRVYTF